MKIHIDIDDALMEDELIIRCSNMSNDIIRFQQLVKDYFNSPMELKVKKQDMDYFLSVEEILFIEKDSLDLVVHTSEDMYYSKLKLYELEELLPSTFVRVSKSTIININKVRGIQKNITGSSVVEFSDGVKRAYVSRNYIKLLLEQIEEKRFKNEK